METSQLIRIANYVNFGEAYMTFFEVLQSHAKKNPPKVHVILYLSRVIDIFWFVSGFLQMNTSIKDQLFSTYPKGYQGGKTC